MTGNKLLFLLLLYPITLFVPNAGWAFQSSEEFRRDSMRVNTIYQELILAEKSQDTTQVVQALSNFANEINQMYFWSRRKEISDRLAKLVDFAKDESIKIEAMKNLSKVVETNLQVDLLDNSTSSPNFFSVQDSMIYWLKRAEEVAYNSKYRNELGGIYLLIGIRYYFKARIGYNKPGHRNFDTAFVYLDKSKKLAQELQNHSLEASSIVWQAYAHIKEENYELGFEKTKQAYNIAEKYDLPNMGLRLNIFDAMYGNYVRMLPQGVSDTLLWLRRENSQARNRIVHADLTKELAEMDREYETTYTQNQLAQQEEINHLQQAQLNQRNTIIGVIILLFTGAGFGFIYVSRLNTKNKKLAERNELLIKEQNHRVKNNLQMVSSLLSLQANRSDGESRKQMLEGSLRVQAIALLHRKLYDDLEGVKEVNIKEFVQDLIEDLLFASGKQNIPVKLDLDEITFPVEKSVHLALILNELITNSIKHAFSRELLNEECIVLKLIETDGILFLEYRDKGGCFDVNRFKESDSFGNKIIRMQSEYLGTFEIKDKDGFYYSLKVGS